ncbi:cytochrome P450 71A12-like [Solanum verrucosum]|uniref:cytochrome P450 71A12-like n=1 Tax=Solanum verrucosum TaxID=315347 RepID=UPI0020D0A34E|nr:cytochrome P450 71A12-like [Solanum verrucosum]
MSMRFGQVPIIVASSPHAAEQFLKKHDLIFASRPKNRVAQFVAYNQRNLTFAKYGPYWRNMRKLCTLELLSTLKINLFQSMRKQEVGNFVTFIYRAATSGVEVDISAMRIGDSSSEQWHPAKDAARDLKDCVRRLYTHAYYSWSEIPNTIHQAMFNEFKTMCTWEPRYNLVITTTFERRASARLSSWLKKVRDSGERSDWMLPHVFNEFGLYWNTNKFKAMSEQAKKARGNLKDGSLHTRGAKTVGTIAREMIVYMLYDMN